MLALQSEAFAPTTSLARNFNAWSSSSLASTTEEAGTTTYRAPQTEIDRRRNLAIISHPDSGKTTMTEKLLLYGGALQQAGAGAYLKSFACAR